MRYNKFKFLNSREKRRLVQVRTETTGHDEGKTEKRESVCQPVYLYTILQSVKQFTKDTGAAEI